MSTRMFSRVRFKVEATIRAGKRKFRGGVENMSMTGMLLVTEERLPEGEPVEIKVVLTGTEPPLSLDFNGRVSRIIENGMGITFEKIDLDSYIHLKNIVSYNTDDPEKVQDEIWHSIDEKLVAEK